MAVGFMVALLPFATPATAEPDPAISAVQAAAGLVAPGADAIRFTAVQPEGRGATIYEAMRGPGGTTRIIIDLMPGPGGAWAVATRETRPLAGETLDYFRGLIDAAFAKAAAPAPCDGGPAYRAEHGANGVGGCGTEGAVPAIARAMGLADPVSP